MPSLAERAVAVLVDSMPDSTVLTWAAVTVEAFLAADAADDPVAADADLEALADAATCTVGAAPEAGVLAYATVRAGAAQAATIPAVARTWRALIFMVILVFLSGRRSHCRLGNATEAKPSVA
ncbi:hypothetical protein GCM10023147_01140 [Tsukamurella soli]|uniref:Uncharacterized protein n=1 Tax=Tsukamurella soli TaxID=644556 RepID=A0ABP8J0T2_9ACTN